MLGANLIVLSGKLPSISDILTFNDMIYEDLLFVLAELLLLVPNIFVLTIDIVLVIILFSILYAVHVPLP